MNTTVRQLQGQELFDALCPLDQYCHHSSPPYMNEEEWMSLAHGRKGLACCAVFEEETAVSIAISSPMTQNMRGALYPASGIWGVSTHPSARRKGYCRKAMSSLLAYERESGKVFSNLYPFRESFYERLGYASLFLARIARLTPQSLTPLLKLALPGEIELSLIGDSYPTYRQYLAKMRETQHGMAFFDFGDEVAACRNRFWLALAKFNGAVEGLMLYSLQGGEPTKYHFIATRFYYMSSRARCLLLNWIARHVDQADRVELWLAGDEYPETWLADLQVRIESSAHAAMIRVLDVAKIGGMQVGEGSAAVEIVDPFCPWNERKWLFEAHDGRLLVSEASTASCTLTIQGLSALAAGTRDPQDLPLLGWGDPDDQMQAVLRRMFPRLFPYLHENF